MVEMVVSRDYFDVEIKTGEQQQLPRGTAATATWPQHQQQQQLERFLAGVQPGLMNVYQMMDFVIKTRNFVIELMNLVLNNGRLLH